MGRLDRCGQALPAVIVLDTSALLALLDEDDPDHAACVTALRSERPPFLVPAGILAEVGYMIERKVGLEVLCAFIDDLNADAWSLDCGEGDLARIRELVHRYGNLSLGLADASVVACAERSGGRVLTLDRRDLATVAREGTINLVLDNPSA